MNRKHLIAAALYALMLAYASLFPFQGWHLPQEGMLAWCAPHFPDRISRSDLLVNVIAYLPLGFLLLRMLPHQGAKALPLLLATAAGTALSFAMELTQTFLPSRTSSTLDLFTNGSGTMLGALFALCWRESAAPQGALGRWRDRHLRQGVEAEIGAGVVLCWALSQLAPFVPSLDLGSIKNALKPLWYAAHDLSRFDLPHAATYCCYLAALGVVAQGSVRQRSLPLLRGEEGQQRQRRKGPHPLQDRPEAGELPGQLPLKGDPVETRRHAASSSAFQLVGSEPR